MIIRCCEIAKNVKTAKIEVKITFLMRIRFCTQKWKDDLWIYNCFFHIVIWVNHLFANIHVQHHLNLRYYIKW